MRVFSPEWFRHHQRTLLWFLNLWLLGRLFRRSLGMVFLGAGDTVTDFGPHFCGVADRDGKKRYELYGTEFLARRLARVYAPLWMVMHLWDKVADPLVPRLSFGFGTYGPYSPGKSSGTTCDGEVSYNVDGTWASIHDAAVADGVSVTQTTIGPGVEATNLPPSNRWSKIARIFMSFNTSVIGGSETVYKSTISFQRFGYATDPFNGNARIGIVTSNQSNPGTLVGSNYVDFNDDVETNTYTTVATWNASGGGAAYGLITLGDMESNYASINTTGITKLGARISYDIDDSPPTWVQNGQCNFFYWAADNVSGYQPPRLTVYTMGGAPTLSPATNVTSSSMRINWTGSAPAYKIDVATDAAFSELVVSAADTDTTTYHDVTGLTRNTTYYYRVWGYYAANGSSTAKADSSQATALSTPATSWDWPTTTLSDTDATMEYSVDGGTEYTVCDASTTSLASVVDSIVVANDIIVRYTGDTDPDYYQTIDITLPSATFSWEDYTLTGATTAMQYSIDGGVTYTTVPADSDLTSVVSGIEPRYGIRLRYTGQTAEYQNVLSVFTYETSGANAYTLVGSDSTMEYLLEGGDTYTACTSNMNMSSLKNSLAGLWKFRVRYVGSDDAGGYTQIYVPYYGSRSV